MDMRTVRGCLMGKLEANEDRSGHHIFYYIFYDGRKYLGGKMSHSWRGDFDDQKIDWLKKPLMLTKNEFQELIDCPMTKDQFFTLWANRKGLSS